MRRMSEDDTRVLCVAMFEKRAEKHEVITPKPGRCIKTAVTTVSHSAKINQSKARIL